MPLPSNRLHHDICHFVWRLRGKIISIRYFSVLCCVHQLWTTGPYSQKCGWGAGLESGKHSNGGNKGADRVGCEEGVSLPVGWGLGEGVPLPRNFFLFSPSKWCILMHSGTHFIPTVIVAMMFMTSTVTFLSWTCSTVQQKGRPRNFCVDFSGAVQVSTPVTSLWIRAWCTMIRT